MQMAILCFLWEKNYLGNIWSLLLESNESRFPVLRSRPDPQVRGMLYFLSSFTPIYKVSGESNFPNPLFFPFSSLLHHSFPAPLLAHYRRLSLSLGPFFSKGSEEILNHSKAAAAAFLRHSAQEKAAAAARVVLYVQGRTPCRRLPGNFALGSKVQGSENLTKKIQSFVSLTHCF